VASFKPCRKCWPKLTFFAPVENWGWSPKTTCALVRTTCTHTHTHTQPFYGSLDFVQDNLGEPVPEETFTHSHSLWSSIVLYLLHPSNTIHSILSVQSTCLTTVFFHNLSPSFLWSTSWPGTLHFILHTFLHPIVVFAKHAHTIATCFTLLTKIMSSNLVSLLTLYMEFYLVVSCHTSI